ncbi:MAG: phosphate acyltransferase, partial [Saccharofermentanaceae bacterium]
MAFIDEVKARAKADKKTIILPESMDRRTFEAAAEILAEDIADIVIIGSKEECAKNSEGLDISKAVIVDPNTNPKTEEYINGF